MLLRFPRSFTCLAVLAVFCVISGCAPADDHATVANHEKKIADLEARVAALEKQPKLDPKPLSNEEEYGKQKGGAFLDALLIGDAAAVRGAITVKLLKAINFNWEIDSFQHNVAVDDWVHKSNPMKQFKSYTIDKVVVSPAKDEIVLSGSVAGKNQAGQAVNGTFAMTLVKEKDKYLLDAFAIKEK
jgi:hypothetical protein